MFYLISGITARIFSSSFMGVFQKLLLNRGENRSTVNFYTYFGLTVLGIIFCSNNLIFEPDILEYVTAMGILGALGNYYIIKALSYGELSTLAPINSFKPITALIIGIIMLNEIPGIKEIMGIILIIAGTILLNKNGKLLNKACFYRFLALMFSGTEAVFIKKVILMSDIISAFFYWALSGLIFSTLIAIKHPFKIKTINIKFQIFLILCAGLMQYSTNYVFANMNVSYALAIFQLSTILSVFLGANIFKEKELFLKLSASVIMVTGAIIILL